MKIREKLFLGFGLYIFLAVVLGFFAYKDLGTIGRHLMHVETADDLTSSLLEVRRYEKNYLLYKDQASVVELRKYLAELSDAAGRIRTEIIGNIGEEHYNELLRHIGHYQQLIRLIGENYRSQADLMDLIRNRGRAAEHAVSGNAYEEFLVLRRYEKNIMLYKNGGAYETFRRTYESSGLTANAAVQNYTLLVAKLHHLHAEEQTIVDSIRRTARQVQTYTDENAANERTAIANILRVSIILVFCALGLIIVIGTVVNMKLAKSIVTPIHDLERVTKKISRGDFSETITVKGHDEIASLAESFNQMEQKLDHAMTSLEDIIKQLQEKQAQLVEAEKLASIGKLAAGIAHEINNPLTSVLTFSNLMLEQCPPDDPRHGKLKLMARETDRARTIVRQLLNFGRESVIKPVKIDINQPVTEITESLVAQEAFKGIELTMNLADGLPEVYADPAQFGQVVLNILLNAIHAITPPGRIEVTTRRTGKNVEVVFSDTGKGIAEEHLHKIFDPFFTTKSATKGTGLGLAVSYGIIKKHGGDIVVESTPGRGSVFTVRMPTYG